MNAVIDSNGPAYAVVDGDVHRDRDKVIGIWRGNLGSEHRLNAKYDWFYLQCPWGEPLLQALRHEPTGEWVGVAAIGPRRMLWQGREIRAGVLVDMAVTARHRTLGPALILQQGVIDRAMEHFELIYGFPNPKAVAVVKRVGYRKLGDIVRCSRVLRHAPYLQRLMPHALALPLGGLIDVLDRIGDVWRSWRTGHCDFEWSDRVDPRMQALWTEAQPGNGLLSVRDAVGLRWRFDQSGVHRSRYLLVGAHRGGPLTAWFACQVEDSTLHVRDFWSVGAAHGTPRAAVEALVRAARAEGHSVISVQYAGPHDTFAAWRAARFVERDRRPVFGKWRASLEPAVRTGAIYLTPADEDE